MNKTEIWGVRDLSKGTCVVGQLDVPGGVGGPLRKTDWQSAPDL